MAGGNRTFTFTFAGDAKGLEKALGGVSGKTSGFASKMKGWATKVAGFVAGAFVIDKLIEFGSGLANLGRQADQWEKKAAVVFGGQMDNMRQWADGVNESLGMTERAVLGVGAGMADLLKPMGFTEEQAAAMTQETVGLAGALSAWSAGQYDAAQVSDILSKAMLGERDQLKSLGISINQAEVDTRALAIAKAEGRDEIEATDAALATQQLILEKSTDAQQAWADGTMGAIQAQNELKARVDSAKEAVGMWVNDLRDKAVLFLVNEGIPAFERFAEWAGPNVTQALDGVRAWWDDNGPGIRDWLINVKDRALEFGEGFMEAWNEDIGPALSFVMQSVRDLSETVGIEFGATDKEVDESSKNWGDFGRDVGMVLGGISYAIGGVVKAIDGLISAVNYITPGTVEGISGLDVIRWTVDRIESALNGAREAFWRFRDAVRGGISIPGLDSVRSGLDSIANSGVGRFFTGRNHSGGVVPGAPGSPQLRLLEGGEVVRSRSMARAESRQGSGGGGVQVVVQGNIYGDGRAIIEAIERAVRNGQRASWLRTAGVS